MQQIMTFSYAFLQAFEELTLKHHIFAADNIKKSLLLIKYVYMCFVVTCWERTDLLALVCGVFCESVTFPLVSWVRCGT